MRQEAALSVARELALEAVAEQAGIEVSDDEVKALVREQADQAEDDPEAVIEEIHRVGRGAGLAINPETPAERAMPYLDAVDLLLVMTVNPGWGGQAFMSEVLPKLAALRAEADRRGLELPIAVDGGVNLDTIGPAHRAGGDVLVTGSALYASEADLRPTVRALRDAARAASVTTTEGSRF
jgi:ribulose-phosphate 3-epimerase